MGLFNVITRLAHRNTCTAVDYISVDNKKTEALSSNNENDLNDPIIKLQCMFSLVNHFMQIKDGVMKCRRWSISGTVKKPALH